jgi:hypothetical protein
MTTSLQSLPSTSTQSAGLLQLLVVNQPITNLKAFPRTGRNCYGIEIDPLYVDTAIRRWHRETGEEAIHAESGKRFEEMEVTDEKR